MMGSSFIDCKDGLHLIYFILLCFLDMTGEDEAIKGSSDVVQHTHRDRTQYPRRRKILISYILIGSILVFVCVCECVF